MENVRISKTYLNRWRKEKEIEYNLYFDEALEELKNIIKDRKINDKMFIYFDNLKKENINVDNYSSEVYEKLKKTEKDMLNVDLIVLLKKNKDDIIELLNTLNLNRDSNIIAFMRNPDRLYSDEFELKVYYKENSKNKTVYEKPLPGRLYRMTEESVKYTFIVLYLMGVVLNNPYRS